MIRTEQQAVEFILDNVGTPYSNWYVGIAADVKARLFDDHNVETDGQFTYCKVFSEQQARGAEKTLLTKGFDGGTGGGDQSTVFVYAYYKTRTTVE